MLEPKIPENEKERLEALKRYNILDTEPENDFDDLVLLASQICDVPITFISLLDTDRQWFKAKIGTNENETARNISFCGHAINDDEIFVVPDAKKDIRFHNNPRVTEGGIRFYAGKQLKSSDGYNLGVLCVIDNKPRKLSDYQLKALEILANQAINQIELRNRIDIHKNNSSALLERVNKLEKKNYIYQKLLSIISHDLRSPLLSIGSLSELYAQDEFSEIELKENLLSLSNDIKNTTKLLDNIINWAIASQKKSTELISNTPVDLYEVIETVINLLNPLAKEKNNKIENKVIPHLIINSDVNMLSFIIRNLVQNSVKFTSNGTIIIEAFYNENNTLIYIKDNGKGIELSKLAKLNQLNEIETTLGTNNEKGFGLGITVSKEFAEKLGGSLFFESVPSEGTKVTLTLNH